MRFHSAPVIRLGDGKRMQLGHLLKADGRWRLLAFAGAGDMGQTGGDIAQLCAKLTNTPASPIMRYTPKEADIDSLIDMRAVFQTPHREMRLEGLPALLLPTKGRYGLIDYEKTFCADGGADSDIYDLRGINRQHGALLIIRPDQFVAAVLSLADAAGVAAFFEGFMIRG